MRRPNKGRFFLAYVFAVKKEKNIKNILKTALRLLTKGIFVIII